MHIIKNLECATQTKMTRQKRLLGLEKVTEFIKIVVASGYIADDKPLSLLLVAPVSSGKTTAIKQFKNNKNIAILTDLTAYGVLKTYQKELENGEIKHIFVPDLLNALSRRKTTVETFLLFINSTSEDGLFPSTTYSIDIRNYIEPFGWVLCVTEDGFKSKKKYLDSIGFSSRFLTIHYKYTPEQINLILQNIVNDTKFVIPDEKLKIRKKKIKIEGNQEIYNELITYSKLLCKNGETEILRIQRQLQTFLKANAYLRGSNKVQKEDLDKLRDLIELIK